MSEPKSTANPAWQRWEMARFDSPRVVRQAASPSDAAAQKKQRDALMRLQLLAHEKGHAQGYEQGHAQGLAEGMREGRAAGHAQGYAEGHAQGQQSGIQEGQAIAQQHAQQLQALTQACTQALERLENEVGQALVQLAVSIAQQILRSTLTVQPEKIRDSVRDIVQMHGDGEAVLTLHVHPQDHDLVHAYLTQDAILKRWRLCIDPHIEPGGCRAETALGAIDATLQTRWRNVVETLGVSAPAFVLQHKR